jgi:hypothetical protein
MVERQTRSVSDILGDKGFAAVKPGETPTARALWGAVGGTRGLVEALLPGIGFLVVYTLTQNLVWSVSAPVTVAIGFIAARLIQRSPLTPAIAGLVGIAASAGVALWSGRAEDNFLLGFIVNGVWIAGLLISLMIRRPLVGVVAGLLAEDPRWHDDVATRRVATWATWMWVGMFSLRLSVQLPLYWAGAVSTLAMWKLLLGVPLYAAVLWITWLLMRAVYRGRDVPSEGEPAQ